MSDWFRRDGSGPITYEQFHGEGQKWGAEARVALTDLPNETRVSTVFLGLDHGWGEGHRPQIFETLVFGGRFDQAGERYSSEEEALEGHRRWVEKAAATNPPEVEALAALMTAAPDGRVENALAVAEHLIAVGVRLPEAASLAGPQTTTEQGGSTDGR